MGPVRFDSLLQPRCVDLDLQVAARWNYFIEHAFPLRPGQPIAVPQQLNKIKIDEKDSTLSPKTAHRATASASFLGSEDLKARSRSPNLSEVPLNANSFGPPVLSLDHKAEVYAPKEKGNASTSAVPGAAPAQAGVSVLQLLKRLAADQLFMSAHLCKAIKSSDGS